MVTVSRTAPVSVLSELMEEEEVRTVVVTDESGDSPVGIVTDHDLKNCVYEPAPSRKTVGEIVSKRVVV